MNTVHLLIATAGQYSARCTKVVAVCADEQVAEAVRVEMTEAIAKLWADAVKAEEANHDSFGSPYQLSFNDSFGSPYQLSFNDGKVEIDHDPKEEPPPVLRNFDGMSWRPGDEYDDVEIVIVAMDVIGGAL